METQLVFLCERGRVGESSSSGRFSTSLRRLVDGNSFADVICCCLQMEGPKQLLMHIGCVARRPTARLSPPVT